MKTIAVNSKDLELFDILETVNSLVPFKFDLTSPESLKTVKLTTNSFVGRVTPDLMIEEPMLFINSIVRAVSTFDNGALFIKLSSSNINGKEVRMSKEVTKLVMYIVSIASSKGYICVLNNTTLFWEVLYDISKTKLSVLNTRPYVYDESNVDDLYDALVSVVGLDNIEETRCIIKTTIAALKGEIPRV